MASVGRANARYLVAKFWHAAEECLQEVLVARPGVAAPSPTPLGLLTTSLQRFKDAYAQRLTSVMYMAGPAMAPGLNNAALQDRDALEKMVVRQIPRASPRNVFVGDVVAFKSPLPPTKDEQSDVMVRRVAAVEGEELVTASPQSDKDLEEEVMEVPKGQCWVLADNEKLKPPQVMDSRTFGFIPMSNIIGRVIFAGNSLEESGPVSNNPISADLDQAIIEAEIDPEQLFGESK